MGRGREEPETLVEQLEQQQRNMKIEKTMERGRCEGVTECERSMEQKGGMEQDGGIEQEVEMEKIDTVISAIVTKFKERVVDKKSDSECVFMAEVAEVVHSCCLMVRAFGKVRLKTFESKDWLAVEFFRTIYYLTKFAMN